MGKSANLHHSTRWTPIAKKRLCNSSLFLNSYVTNLFCELKLQKNEIKIKVEDIPLGNVEKNVLKIPNTSTKSVIQNIVCSKERKKKNVYNGHEHQRHL